MRTLRVAKGFTAGHRGLLAAGNATRPCSIGRAGIRAMKREGDGASPRGRFRLELVLYRADRIARPRTRLPVRAIRPTDGWCDDPRHFRYNRPVTLPFAAGHERLWREDRLYDLVVVLSHNQRPRVRGLGSAVFVHVAPPGLGPTQGCVALPLPALRRLVERAGPESILALG